MYKRLKLFFIFSIIALSCKPSQKKPVFNINPSCFSDKEEFVYKLETIKGESLGTINFKVEREKNLIKFSQTVPESYVFVNPSNLEPVSSSIKLNLPGRGPFELISEFRKNEVTLKVKTSMGEQDTTVKVEDNFFHSDFVFMVIRAFPLIEGDTYNLKAFVPFRAQIMPFKVIVDKKEEIEIGKKKYTVHKVIFDYGKEKHKAYYEESKSKRLLLYDNGRNRIVIRL